MLEPIDTALRLETPEGTEIELHPVGLIGRAVAFATDEVLRWTMVVAGFVIGGFAGLMGYGFALIVLFFTYWLYGVAFEVLNNGQTPGKRSQGMRVVHDDGTPIRLPASMLRNLLLVVDMLPTAYAAGIISISTTARFQRLGDLVAGTLVVREHRPPEWNTATLSERKRAPVVLSEGEQAVLVDYLEREAELSAARARELGEILAPGFKFDPRTAVDELRLIGSGLKGG